MKSLPIVLICVVFFNLNGLIAQQSNNTIIKNVTINSFELESEIVMSDAILVGSPTINQNTLLPVYKLFSLINPLRDKSKIAGAFGSYGWSGEAPKIITDSLRNLKLKVFEESIALKFFPGDEKASALKDYGRRFAAYVLAECDNKT